MGFVLWLILFYIFAFCLVIYWIINAPLIDDSFEENHKIKDMYCQEIKKHINIPLCNDKEEFNRMANILIEKCYRKNKYNAKEAARIIERYIKRYGGLRIGIN